MKRVSTGALWEQVFANFIGESASYTPGGGKVALAAALERGCLRW